MTALTPTQASPRQAPGALPSALKLGLARTVIELKQFFRTGAAVAFIFAYPIIMLGIFASVFGDQTIDFGPGAGSVGYAQYFLPGMIATGLMLTSFQSVATGITEERDDGSLKRLRGTPMPPSAYFVGKIGQVLITAVVQVALLLVLAATAFSVPMPTQASQWATFAWTFLLGTAGGTVLGIAYSSFIKSGRAATAMVLPPVLILQFISGVFFQFDQLPSWMQNIASIFPLKWIAQSMRSVFLPDSAQALELSGTWQHGLTAAVLGVWLVAGFIIAVRSFRWQQSR